MPGTPSGGGGGNLSAECSSLLTAHLIRHGVRLDVSPPDAYDRASESNVTGCHVHHNTPSREAGKNADTDTLITLSKIHRSTHAVSARGDPAQYKAARYPGRLRDHSAVDQPMRRGFAIRKEHPSARPADFYMRRQNPERICFRSPNR